MGNQSNVSKQETEIIREPVNLYINYYCWAGIQGENHGISTYIPMFKNKKQK